jgi:hypothetical protein
LPVIDDGHIIQIDPIITLQDLAPNFVHHMIVHVCEPGNGTNWNKYQTPDQCISPLGNPNSGCTSLLYAWAGTQGPEILPPQVGFRMGTRYSTSVRNIIIETHFDNPKLIPNLRDHSGVRIYYTAESKRPYDAAVMVIGDPLISFRPIPPLQQRVPYQGSCPSMCTSDWDHDITVFGDFLHMHTAGSQMFSVITRDEQPLQELNRVDFYSFDFQQQTPVNVVLKRGDQINTHCTYKTLSRVNKTTFGLESTQEMCMEFLTYYPALYTKGNKPFPWSLCGFVDPIRDGTGNATWCGGYDPTTSLKMVPNPSVFDPPSYDEIKFGKVPASCASANPPDTSSISPTNPDNGGGVSSGVKVLLVFVSLGILAVGIAIYFRLMGSVTDRAAV